MLALENDVEITALHRRGWSVAAIARHLGRSRTTVRAYLRGQRTVGVRRRAAPDAFAAYAPYVCARLTEDPHVWASALYDEVCRLGYPRSYPRFTAALRRGQLRPHCEPCAGVRGRPTIEIPHPPGDELQWDWLELPSPWGPGDAHVLMGTLAYSGQTRGVFSEAEDQPHLIAALDAVLRQFGGTARRWRFDRMSTVVAVGTGRVLASFAPVAKHYGVELAICPPRRGNRKGCVEKANHFGTQRWWRTAVVASAEGATRALAAFQGTIGDSPVRDGQTVAARAAAEGLLALPTAPYPATVAVTRMVGPSALVAYRGNSYSVPPACIGAVLTLQQRLGTSTLAVVGPTGPWVAEHRLAPAGAGVIVRLPVHQAALEHVVLAAAAPTAPSCHRKANRPPGPAAHAAAAALRGLPAEAAPIDLEQYAAWAAVAL